VPLNKAFPFLDFILKGAIMQDDFKEDLLFTLPQPYRPEYWSLVNLGGDRGLAVDTDGRVWGFNKKEISKEQ
jgi:hypothetical protein